MKSTQENKKKYGFYFSIIIVLILLSFLLGNTLNRRENFLLKTILIADNSFSEVSVDGQMADRYYAEASFAYEEGDYNSVETNCRIAREYYLKESQGYKRIKAELKAREIEDKLIDIYIDFLDTSIEIANNMFEACEHFESAARYYDKYYNTDVPYDDSSHDMGTSEIDMMNEKIRNHDEAVERYNNLLEEFKIELESRI